MPNKKIVSTLLCSFFSFGLIGGTLIATHNSDTVLRSSASSESSNALLLNEVSLDDFSSSVEVTRKELTVDIRSANKTPLSKSLTFEFESIRTKGYASSKKTAYVVIDDENYSGDTSDPLLDPSKGTGLNGYTIELGDVSINKDATKNYYVVPAQLKWGSSNLFQINNKSIKAGSLDLSAKVPYGTVDEAGKAVSNAAKISAIYIPSEIVTVESNALVGIFDADANKDKINIFCEAASKPSGWADDWTDAFNVSWGATIAADEKVVITGSTEKNFDKGTPFFVGYSSEKAQYNKPLVISYTIKSASGDRNVIEELPLNPADTSRANPYDAVGSIGNYQLTRSYDVILEEGETLDYSSFKFYNIYKVSADKDPDTGKVLPDLTTSYYAGAIKRFRDEIDITSIIKYEFVKASTFLGYTNISMNIDKVMPSYYETIMGDELNVHRDKMDTGEYSIRYAFYDLTNSSYAIEYESGGEIVKKVIPVSTPLSVVVLGKDSGNQISFLVKNSDVGNDFSIEKLRSFSLIKLTINMHLWNNEGNNIVAHTAYNAHFGEVDVMPSMDSAPKMFNINTFLIIFFIVYTLLFAATAVVLFFVLREKFKNDEFRRMKPKSYIKKALISYVGSAIVLLAILSVIFRTTALSNSIATFNPTDVFVVIAGIVSIVIIGYFVKFMIAWIKTNKQRKQFIKLKINQDVAEDGTK